MYNKSYYSISFLHLTFLHNTTDFLTKNAFLNVQSKMSCFHYYKLLLFLLFIYCCDFLFLKKNKKHFWFPVIIYNLVRKLLLNAILCRMKTFYNTSYNVNTKMPECVTIHSFVKDLYIISYTISVFLFLWLLIYHHNQIAQPNLKAISFPDTVFYWTAIIILYSSLKYESSTNTPCSFQTPSLIHAIFSPDQIPEVWLRQAECSGLYFQGQSGMHMVSVRKQSTTLRYTVLMK